jgi:hypothetical protein
MPIFIRLFYQTNFINTTKLKLISFYIGGLLAFLFLNSCKDPSFSDDNLLLNGDNINVHFTDSFIVKANTEEDTVLQGHNLTKSLLGSTIDSRFGKLYASFYNNFRLLSNNVNLGSGLTIDSCFLTYGVAKAYGPFSSPMNIVVYELNEPLVSTTSYLTNRAFAVKLPEIANVTIPYNGSSTINIKLSNSFGQNIVNQSGGANLANNDAFQSFFNGVYVTTNTAMSGDGILNLDLIDGASKLTLYYHAAGDTTKKYDIPVNDLCSRVNHYYRNTAGSPAQLAADLPTAMGEDKAYLEGLTSFRAKVMIDNLDTFKNVAVNKAELWVFPLINSSADSAYKLPAQIYASRINDGGNDIQLLDFLSGTMVGTRDTTKVGGVVVPVYKINLTRYAQSIINKEFTNNGLRIYVFPTNITAERMVICGGNHATYPMKFRLITTKTN